MYTSIRPTSILRARIPLNTHPGFVWNAYLESILPTVEPFPALGFSHGPNTYIFIFSISSDTYIVSSLVVFVCGLVYMYTFNHPHQ